MQPRGRGAVGFHRGRGAGGFPVRGRGTVVARREMSGNEAKDRHPNNVPAVSPSGVVTAVTDSGTELPARLNNKVFMDGLPYENSRGDGQPSVEEELLQFATAWKVGRPIRLIKKNGQGFGFLVFRSPNSVDTAVRVLNGRKFLGRALRVSLPKPKDPTGLKGSPEDEGKTNFERQILLSDLAKVAQPEIIREVLRDVAPQLEKRLETVKMTSRNRKAFLTFAAPDDVDAALRFLDGFMMFGRRVAATRAAAPGSLPYSKHPVPSRVSALDTRHAAGDAAEEPLRPLGVEVDAAVGAAKGRRAAQDTARGRSNVTGVTERYNLLDNGPAEIYVGGVGEEVTEEQLRTHFAPCGRIASCELVVNPNAHTPTGIARVVFALPAYAAYAQQHFHGSRLHGHVLRVDRGDTASAPLSSQITQPDEEEEVDEDAYMERYGVTDKKAYFKGTSLEEKRPRKAARKDTGTRNGKHAREEVSNDDEEEEGEGKEKTVKEKGGKRNKMGNKKTKKEEATFTFSESVPMGNGNDDSDEEECFRDVDDVDVPTATIRKVGKGKKSTKQQIPKKGKKKTTR